MLFHSLDSWNSGVDVEQLVCTLEESLDPPPAARLGEARRAPSGFVHVVGTPQFAPYADLHLQLSRKEFFFRFGADPGRPLICYSRGDAGTCPEDPDHVRVLMDLVLSGRIQGQPQVIVRPTPVDDARRGRVLAQRLADHRVVAEDASLP
jgi:hypothetical protein